MPLTLLVLADPKSPWLKLLEGRIPDAVVVVHDAESARARAADADVLLTGTFDSVLVDAALPRARRARWVHSMWTGVEKMMSPVLLASPLPFTNARGVFRRPLGEWTLGVMLHFSYDLRRVIRQQEAGVWQPFEAQELHGKTLGIIGYGGRVLALRRRPELSGDDSLVDRAYPPSQIDEVMAASDYVLVAAPLTRETRGLVGEAQIAAMKTSAVIINVGRGPVIDEAALVRALEAGRIRGAALDVFDVEPLPHDHPFYRMQNVLMSPHTADRVRGFFQLPVECFLENMRRFRAGEPLLNIVDKHSGY